MRIILDVVINHSGDNWTYPGGFAFFYSNDQQFAFGAFRRRPDRPVPTELRNDDCTTAAAGSRARGYDTLPGEPARRHIGR